MAKINFTKDHFDRLCSLSLEYLFENHTVFTKIGSPLTISELLHTTTIGTLNEIKFGLTKKIEKLEETDEWVKSDIDIDFFRKQKELVNLIIGYKRLMLERTENARKKEELTKKLNELKESTKTPEDRIKELEVELAGLDNEEF